MRRKRAQTSNITVKGDFSGQIAMGDHNRQTITKIRNQITLDEMNELRRLLSELRTRVEATANAETKEPALEQVQTLEDAITAKKPNVSKMDKVRTWFGKYAPSLLGSVTSVIVHPIVGKLVEAGGDLLVQDFQRRFGSDSQSTT
jgi:hypothetical protein